MHVLCSEGWTRLHFVLYAVTDMFYDAPYNLDDNDATCYRQFGIRAQYNWAAYK